MLKSLLSSSFFALLLGNISAQTPIFEENFNAGTTLPAGWSQTTLATDGGWIIGDADALSSQYFPVAPGDGNMLATNDDACDCNKSNDLLILPSVNLTGITSVYLLFDLYYWDLANGAAQESLTLQASTNNGVTWTAVKTFTGNPNWRLEAIDLSAYAGNADLKLSFKYNDGGGWLYGAVLDNIRITEPDDVLKVSVGGTAIGRYVDAIPAIFSDYTKFWAGQNFSIASSIQNNGFAPINSFTASWTNGTQTVSQSFDGLNLGIGGFYDFTLDVPISLGANTGDYEVSVSNINGGADNDVSDNSTVVTLDVEGVEPAPGRKVVVEEGTGTWCQWCPRGAVMMDFLGENYPVGAVPIAVHNDDPMKVTVYDNGFSQFISGYPSGAVDRVGGDVDPLDFEKALINRLSTPAPVSVQHNVAYNAATRLITVESQLHFQEAMNGNFRIAMVITENDVTGLTGTWRQQNAYAGGGNGPMGGYENLPSLVPAAQMVYNHVARTIVGTFTGTANSVPATNPAGSVHTFTSTYTHPTTQDVTQMHAITMLINTTTGEIINAEQTAIPFTITSSNEPTLAGVSVEVYPNPVADQATVTLKLAKQTDVQLRLTDVSGKVVYEANFGNMNGEHNLPLRLQHLNTGTYILSVNAGNGVISKPVVVLR